MSREHETFVDEMDRVHGWLTPAEAGELLGLSADQVNELADEDSQRHMPDRRLN